MLTIITINFNGSEKTINLLKSLKEQTDKDFSIIVVDNASEEADFGKLEKYYTTFLEPTLQGAPLLKLVRNQENLGFSGGNNVGIRMALQNGSEWVFLLNNDTWVERGFIAAIKPKLSDSGGVVGVAIDEGNRVAYCGQIKWLRAWGKHMLNRDDAVKETDKYIIGGAMAIHKDVFEKIGFLDEKYFLYFEDQDFSLRAKKAGFKLDILPDIKIGHQPSSSTKKLGAPLLMRYHYRNALYLNLKNGPLYIKLFVWPWSWIIIIKQLLKIMIYHNREQSIAILIGVFDFYAGRMGHIKI